MYLQTDLQIQNILIKREKLVNEKLDLFFGQDFHYDDDLITKEILHLT